MRVIVPLVLLLTLTSTAAQAGIVIEVLNANMVAGSPTGFVDVVIRSDGVNDPNNTIGRFGYEFTITGASPAAGDLQFRDPQSNSEQTDGGPPAYVFFNDTDPGNFNSTRFDTVTLRGGDIANTVGNSITLTTSNRLLARLELEHIGSTVVGSHQFTVALNALSAFTDFDSDDDIGTDNSYPLSQITAHSGTVTITGTPEPSSLALCGLSAISFCLWQRRRRRLRQ